MREQHTRLVFIDETSVKTNMTRRYGRCQIGKRLYAQAPFGKWNTQTFIAGLTCDELIAPWVLNKAMDRQAFEVYIETQLVPNLEPYDIVIADNLSVHKSQIAAEILKKHKCWFLFLPRYSPDLNPIEMAFSKLKAYLRKYGARTYEELIEAIGDISYMYKPEECYNFFKECGYVYN